MTGDSTNLSKDPRMGDNDKTSSVEPDVGVQGNNGGQRSDRAWTEWRGNNYNYNSPYRVRNVPDVTPLVRGNRRGLQEPTAYYDRSTDEARRPPLFPGHHFAPEDRRPQGRRDFQQPHMPIYNVPPQNRRYEVPRRLEVEPIVGRQYEDPVRRPEPPNQMVQYDPTCNFCVTNRPHPIPIVPSEGRQSRKYVVTYEHFEPFYFWDNATSAWAYYAGYTVAHYPASMPPHIMSPHTQYTPCAVWSQPEPEGPPAAYPDYFAALQPPPPTIPNDFMPNSGQFQAAATNQREEGAQMEVADQEFIPRNEQTKRPEPTKPIN